VHLDRLGREAEQTGDFLGLQMAGDQPQDLALTGREALETLAVVWFYHAASMGRGSLRVQLQPTRSVSNLEHRAEKWPPVFRKAMRKQKARARRAIPTSRTLL